MFTILRQPRYLGLCALMVLLAVGCSIAGTWQIFRFEQKHSANHHLRSDAHDTPIPVSQALGPASQPDRQRPHPAVPHRHRHRHVPERPADPAARPVPRRQRHRLPGDHAAPNGPRRPAGSPRLHPAGQRRRHQPEGPGGADKPGRGHRPAAAGRHRPGQVRRPPRQPDRHRQRGRPSKSNQGPGLERLRGTPPGPARRRRPAGHPGSGHVQPGRRCRGTPAPRLRPAVVPVRAARPRRPVRPGPRRTPPRRRGPKTQRHQWTQQPQNNSAVASAKHR